MRMHFAAVTFFVFICAVHLCEIYNIFFAYNWFARAGASMGGALPKGEL